MLFERSRVHNFRFTSDDFIYFRSLDIRANWFSALVNSENFVDSFPITYFTHQQPKIILENSCNDGIIK